MIITGEDFENLLKTIGIAENHYSWVIPRKRLVNKEVKITGILITGFISHKVLGEALAQGKNVILTSNLPLRFDNTELLESIGDVSYKNDLFIIQWDFQWLIESLQGDSIIAKIFGSGFEDLIKEKSGIYTIEYPIQVNLKSILQRFPDFLLYSNEDSGKVINISFNSLMISIITDIPLSESRKSDIFISLTNLDELTKRKILKQYSYLIEIKLTDFLNEVSREIYFLIKQGEDLEIDLTFNKRFNYIKIKN